MRRCRHADRRRAPIRTRYRGRHPRPCNRALRPRQGIGAGCDQRRANSALRSAVQGALARGALTQRRGGAPYPGGRRKARQQRLEEHRSGDVDRVERSTDQAGPDTPGKSKLRAAHDVLPAQRVTLAVGHLPGRKLADRAVEFQVSDREPAVRFVGSEHRAIIELPLREAERERPKRALKGLRCSSSQPLASRGRDKRNVPLLFRQGREDRPGLEPKEIATYSPSNSRRRCSARLRAFSAACSSVMPPCTEACGMVGADMMPVSLPSTRDGC